MSAINGFTTMAVISGRVTDADRKRKASEILAKGTVDYAGRIDKGTATEVCEGKEKTALDRTLSIKNPASLACDICGDTHGAPTSNALGIWRADLMTKNHVLAQNGHIILVSDSCFRDHIKPQLTAKNCSNFAEVIKRYKK